LGRRGGGEVSYETTLVCDGCSGIIDSGSKVSVIETLEREGGRAFVRARKGGWRTLGPGEDWTRAKRHFGSCCDDATDFGDGHRIVGTQQTADEGVHS
jgi:hypothetical protein